jgi:hypothetical protein
MDLFVQYRKNHFKEQQRIRREQFEKDIANGIENFLQITKCKDCDTVGVIGFVVAGNGSKSIKIVCPSCGYNLCTRYGMQAIGKEYVPNYAMLSVIRDDRDNQKKCSVEHCNNHEVEYHHWAPKHLFGHESNHWPGDYLCREHHTEWHRKTETGAFWKDRQ